MDKRRAHRHRAERDWYGRGSMMDFAQAVRKQADLYLKRGEIADVELGSLNFAMDSLEKNAKRLEAIADALPDEIQPLLFDAVQAIAYAGMVAGPILWTSQSVKTNLKRLQKQDLGRRSRRRAQQAATQWKEDALGVALELDRKGSMMSRADMAARILADPGIDLPVGARQVEIWLQKEAEAPNGPIQSRAREELADNEAS